MSGLTLAAAGATESDDHRPCGCRRLLDGGRRSLAAIRRCRGKRIGKHGAHRFWNTGKSNRGKDKTEHVKRPLLRNNKKSMEIT